jgi:hypothetical protein
MRLRSLSLRQWVGITGFALVFILVAAVAVWRGDILKAGLDPQVPFQTYDPPPAPRYDQASAWALRDARAPGAKSAHVFFVHSTTYEGGKHWNGPVDDRHVDDDLRRGVLPNYAAPFARAGDVSAPRYRQASLYTRLTLREDAREARAFAYRDIDSAFTQWLQAHPAGPIVLVGVEQGADLVDRLLHDRIANHPELKRRLVAAYLMEGVISEARFKEVPLCQSRDAFGCALAWRSVEQGDETEARRVLRRALVWDERGALVGANEAATACVNPVTGSTEQPVSAMRESRGATNATNLEWGARPAFQSRIVAAECRDGILWRSPLNSESFRPKGSWADRRKIPPFNLFYADIESDVLNRIAAWEKSNVA